MKQLPQKFSNMAWLYVLRRLKRLEIRYTELRISQHWRIPPPTCKTTQCKVNITRWFKIQDSK